MVKICPQDKDSSDFILSHFQVSPIRFVMLGNDAKQSNVYARY